MQYKSFNKEQCEKLCINHKAHLSSIKRTRKHKRRTSLVASIQKLAIYLILVFIALIVIQQIVNITSISFFWHLLVIFWFFLFCLFWVSQSVGFHPGGTSGRAQSSDLPARAAGKGILILLPAGKERAAMRPCTCRPETITYLIWLWFWHLINSLNCHIISCLAHNLLNGPLTFFYNMLVNNIIVNKHKYLCRYRTKYRQKIMQTQTILTIATHCRQRLKIQPWAGPDSRTYMWALSIQFTVN